MMTPMMITLRITFIFFYVLAGTLLGFSNQVHADSPYFLNPFKKKENTKAGKESTSTRSPIFVMPQDTKSLKAKIAPFLFQKPSYSLNSNRPMPYIGIEVPKDYDFNLLGHSGPGVQNQFDLRMTAHLKKSTVLQALSERRMALQKQKALEAQARARAQPVIIPTQTKKRKPYTPEPTLKTPPKVFRNY